MISYAIGSLRRLRSSLRLLLNVDQRRFLSANRRFWKRVGAHNINESRVVIAEHAMGGDFWSLVVSISAALVSSAYKAKVIFLMQGKPPRNFIKCLIQKSFCNCDFVYLDENYRSKNLYIKGEAARIFETIKKPDDILRVRYKDVPVGEQVYDAVMKHRHATLWKVDDRVLGELERAVNCVETVLNIFGNYEVVSGIFTHTTCSYHGVAVRTILSKGKPVFLGFGGLNAMYRYNKMLNEKGHLDIHIKIPVVHFERMFLRHKDLLLKEANQYYERRFGGLINDWDAMRAFSPDKKLYKTRTEFFSDYPQLDRNKKNVFVMLHAMNDDPHVQVQHFFKDYYDWFIATLKHARTNSSVNWVFKQHPMIKFYPDDANLYGLFDLLTEEHIVYIDETVPFNQASVPVLADAIVTCGGTAGLEFSAFGIPAIIASGNSYSGYDICREPKSLNEYIYILDGIANIEAVSVEKALKAKVLFYLIYSKLIPGFLTGFFPYMNHDQMKSIGEVEATKLYYDSLKGKMDRATVEPFIRDLINFVREPYLGEDARLYLKL